MKNPMIKFLTATVFTFASFYVSAQNQSDGKVSFVDMLWLQDGATNDDVMAFVSKMQPVMSKYGVKITAGYKPVMVLEGSAEPDFVFTYEYPSFEVLQKMGSDPAFLAGMKERDKVFHPKKRIFIQVAPLPVKS